MLFLENCAIRFPRPLALAPLIFQRSAASAEGECSGPALGKFRHARARHRARGEAQPELVDRPSQAVPAGTSVQLPDVASPFGEPHVAIGPRRDAKRPAIRRRDRELGQFVRGSGAEAPDVVGILLGEPEVAIGPRRDATRPAEGRRDRELGDDPCRGDAPDLVGKGLGEPEVAIGPRRDASRIAARRRDRELADFAGERQGGGSRKRQHAEEQAQEPDK